MDEKVIVITGASSGIGASLAKILGQDGHKLVLAARRENELWQVAKQAAVDAVPVATDVTRRADVQHLKDAALESFGRVDVWVNNAGRGITRPVMDLTDSDIEEMLNVNLKSAIYGMQAVVPYFQQQGKGHLINISSLLGRVPLASFRSIYSASKAALNVLTANLRMDLRADYPNIHVTLVMPGQVANDFAKNALGGTPAFRPSGAMKPQTSEEVAQAIKSVMESPRSEIYTNPVLSEIVQKYRQDTDAFEAMLAKRD